MLIILQLKKKYIDKLGKKTKVQSKITVAQVLDTVVCLWHLTQHLTTVKTCVCFFWKFLGIGRFIGETLHLSKLTELCFCCVSLTRILNVFAFYQSTVWVSLSQTGSLTRKLRRLMTHLGKHAHWMKLFKIL